MPDAHDALVLRREGETAWITINRPAVRNAIDRATWRRMGDLLGDLSADRQISVIVLRGAGDLAFSAGSDIAEFARMTLGEVRDCFREMEATIAAVERVDKPVIACVNGYALGSALELVLACDIQLASSEARFGMPIARLGIMLEPAFAGRLVRVVGPARTRDLLFSGRMMPAAEALQAGLISRMVPAATLEAETRRFIGQLLEGSPRSIEAAKRSVRTIMNRWLPGPAEMAGEEPYYVDGPDFREGVAAFLEKRPPRFERRKVAGGPG